jgi:hypothetical protein
MIKPRDYTRLTQEIITTKARNKENTNKPIKPLMNTNKSEMLNLIQHPVLELVSISVNSWLKNNISKNGD